MDNLQLLGRVILRGQIEAVTGLHIGGSPGYFSIGGNDNPVVVDPVSMEPYIPGSSLRGKMRALTEKAYPGIKFKQHAGVDHIHTFDQPEEMDEYLESDIAVVYGISAVEFAQPTRLIVRDVPLTEASRKKLRDAKTDRMFTEIKMEVSIDRITSQANPRPLERVPRGARFGQMEFVFSIYEQRDLQRMMVLLNGMELLEYDYLGGSGSRGSGQVRFLNLTASLTQLSVTKQIDEVELVSASNVGELKAKWTEMITQIQKRLTVEA